MIQIRIQILNFYSNKNCNYFVCQHVDDDIYTVVSCEIAKDLGLHQNTHILFAFLLQVWRFNFFVVLSFLIDSSKEKPFIQSMSVL